MNADGSGAMPFGPTRSGIRIGSWSPDGQKFAYTINLASNGCFGPDEAIAVSNADGTGETVLTSETNFQREEHPAWSPDGTKIVFHRQPYTCDGDGTPIYGAGFISIMNPDGTGSTDIHQGGNIPAWSPNGGQIAVQCSGICTMNADGTGFKTITDPSQTTAQDAAWSPDGLKIAFTQINYGTSLPEIWVMNADGSGQTRISSYGAFPDWQPLPTTSYAHPQSAPWLQASLVPTFRPCGTGANPTDGQHSPPLGTQACLPPTPGSNVARVGANSIGAATFTVVPGDSDATNGDQANVTLSASLSDVKTTGGADYVPNPSGPDLTEITRLRLTDKANNYGGASGTATEYDFRVPLDCSATADPALGSSCSANTSADSLLPGFVTEQRQTVVQAFRVRVDDAGANGTTGDSDDRIFATQGIYIP